MDEGMKGKRMECLTGGMLSIISLCCVVYPCTQLPAIWGYQGFIGVQEFFLSSLSTRRWAASAILSTYVLCVCVWGGGRCTHVHNCLQCGVTKASFQCKISSRWAASAILSTYTCLCVCVCGGAHVYTTACNLGLLRLH